jgi:hypothetical protein
MAVFQNGCIGKNGEGNRQELHSLGHVPEQAFVNKLLGNVLIT